MDVSQLVGFSVIIPTYNRRDILEKCLVSLAGQDYPDGRYEVIVVDDGSTDSTRELASLFPTVRFFWHQHAGPAAARNRGIEAALQDYVLFIDSDIVVKPDFFKEHARIHQQHPEKIFCYGAVINTCNFDDPTSEPAKLSDFSAAFFATGNVSICRQYLLDVGLFDENFRYYGWEDLELGIRLKQKGIRMVKNPQAAGYHYHPPFNLDTLDMMIEKEKGRGIGAVYFFRKHPILDVRLMCQLTPLHRILDQIVRLGGMLDEQRMMPFLRWLERKGYNTLVLNLCRIWINRYNLDAIRQASRVI